MKYCVDFDGTLCINGKPNTALIMQLKSLQAAGHIVSLFTARKGARLKEAVIFCRRYGLIFHEVIGGKPMADFYIDDRAISIMRKGNIEG